MREKLTMAGAILLLLTVVAIGGFIVYDFGRVLVESVGPFYGLLVILGAVIVFRIADLVAPRRDGESWFWSMFRDE